jgi:hypothetical protein
MLILLELNKSEVIKMTEPEVSLYIALFYIKNGLTDENIKVSIDGAHVKTKNQIHFDIHSFMQNKNCVKTDGDLMVRECVFRKKLSLPRTCKLLDTSHEYWLKRGVTDWGIVVEKEEKESEEE